MKKLKLAGSTAIGIVIGAVVFNSLPAFADLPVIDPASILQETGILNVLNTINGIESDISKYTNEIFGALGDNTYGDCPTASAGRLHAERQLREGAGRSAQQQITDASNMAMARFHRDMRNAQIRDEQTVSPNACTALDGGVSTQAAAVQAFDVAWTDRQNPRPARRSRPGHAVLLRPGPGRRLDGERTSQQLLRRRTTSPPVSAVPSARRPTPISSSPACSARAPMPARRRSTPPRTTRST